MENINPDYPRQRGCWVQNTGRENEYVAYDYPSRSKIENVPTTHIGLLEALRNARYIICDSPETVQRKKHTVNPNAER